MEEEVLKGSKIGRDALGEIGDSGWGDELPGREKEPWMPGWMPSRACPEG